LGDGTDRLRVHHTDLRKAFLAHLLFHHFQHRGELLHLFEASTPKNRAWAGLDTFAARIRLTVTGHKPFQDDLRFDFMVVDS
jgi:hypothetical protein